MQHQDLHLLTVIELRKLAKESGVKLSAGISKEGIVQRLSAALYGDQSAESGEKVEQAQNAQALTQSAESQASVQEEPQTADSRMEKTPEDDFPAPASELSADVTKVQPRGGYRAWQGEEPTAPTPNMTPAYRPAWQARPQQSQATHRSAGYPQPAWQQRVFSAPTRFGPPVSYPAQQSAPQPMMQEEAPARMQPRGPAPAPARDNAPRLDGYRLGYRAAPQRQDYRDYGARQDYRPAPRQEAPYRAPAGYPQQPVQDVYYNDSVYKPVRDPAFSDGFERGQPAPELLQAPEGTPAAGVLEILPDGYGFLRAGSLLPGKKDIYVSVAQIRRYGLRTGDFVQGAARPQRDCDKFAALMYVEKVNGNEPVENPDRLMFDELTPIYPSRRIKLEDVQKSDHMAVRMVDLIAPIGFGQRAMIVAPPESGKNILLRDIASAIRQNDPDAQVMMLLIDERPEEVTEIRDAVEGAEVFASTFDEAPECQTRVADTMMERAQRLVEEKRNVVILLDSLTKLTRAYQATMMQGGRALTNTVTPTALVRPKRFFGAARNTREGGSLTVIATILVETGSRMDDIIFEEFKGTANMELWLETPGPKEPMLPVINLQKSGTKKDSQLLNEEEAEGLRAIRSVLGSTTNREAIVQLISMMEKTKCNADLFARLKDWVAMWEKSGFLVKK